jgi:membrane protease YdiL (CAAX protease family)
LVSVTGKKERKTKTGGKSANAMPLGSSRLLNFAQDSYLERTSRPIYAVIFLLPFIVFYEIGTFRINTNALHQSQTRVVAFVWLQNFLESLGFAGKFAWAAPPLAVIIILLSLQITSRKQWSFWFYDFFLMIGECIFLAAPLIVLTLLISSVNVHHTQSRMDSNFDAHYYQVTVCSSSNNYDVNSSQANHNIDFTERQPLMADIVTGIGAGIYEELVFRLILICVLMMQFQDLLRMSHVNAIVLSVLISAALFSAYHHIDFFTGRPNTIDPFDITEFAFRTIAGVYFAILYAIRGFGITAGTHGCYNIIAVTITAGFFQH